MFMQGSNTAIVRTPQPRNPRFEQGHIRHNRAMSANGSLMGVALRPWPASKKEELSAEDLLLQIEQLSTERKHLRNVTEKSLQDDITAGTEVPEDATDGSEQKKEDKNAPSRDERLQEVFRAQIEMSSHME
jgi:mediator of RNA polymerase II transcription subunit 17